MSNIIQFKRRASGAAGAPAALKSAEPAYNMVDKVLYLGFGDDGNGNATSVVPVGGEGAVVMLTGTQTIGGAKTFATTPKAASAPSAADDLANKSYVDAGLAGKAATGHTHAIADVVGLQSALDGKVAAANAALTGTPIAPTAASGTNTTQIATTAFVSAAVSSLVNGAGAALDTLSELASALGNDANFATTMTTQVGTKCAKAANLSDLANTASARTNLGLGSMATQASTAVAITGGTIGAGVTVNAPIDGGTF